MSKHVEFAVALPRATHTTIHLHLTLHSHALMLFLTTRAGAEEDASGGPPALGSFVYALPNRRYPTQPPLCTNIYVRESSLEFTRRVATLLAKKLDFPVYAGSSMSFESTGMGGSVEEEMESFRKVIDVVLDEVKQIKSEV